MTDQLSTRRILGGLAILFTGLVAGFSVAVAGMVLSLSLDPDTAKSQTPGIVGLGLGALTWVVTALIGRRVLRHWWPLALVAGLILLFAAAAVGYLV